MSIKNVVVFLIVLTVPIACAHSSELNGGERLKRVPSLLEFEIAGPKSTEDMSYVAGFLHALIELKKKLPQSQPFCKQSDVTFNDLLGILNKKIHGKVTAEHVDSVIIEGLIEKYPCNVGGSIKSS